MKAGEVAAVIEAFAPLTLQEEWDNSGFCIGDADSEVHKVLIGFDCTVELIGEAVQNGADMIVTHHPLIFGGISRISESTVVGKAVIEAVRNGIVVYACHTNMDKVLGGVSGKLASLIGLQEVEVLDADASGNGLGVVGNLPEPVETAAFIAEIKRKLSLKCVRTSRPVRKIGRVALCGGSGHSLIGKAMASGADAYISGDIGYHDFFCPEGFMILDIGHFESEVHIMETIGRLLHEKIPNFVVLSGKRTANPVNYF